MNKDDWHITIYSLLVSVLILTFVLLFYNFYKMDELNKRIDIMYSQFETQRILIDRNIKDTERCIKLTKDYTIFVDSVVKKVVNKEW